MPEITTTEKLVQVNDLVNMARKNDTLYPRKTAVTAEIDAKVAAQISSVYKPGGSVSAIADLPALSEENAGKVVNVSGEFTTTADFLEGAGVKYPAGTNVVVAAGADADTYVYDVLSGIVDLSAYATSEGVATDLEGKVDKLEGMGLSSNDYTTAEKTKLASLEVASSAEVDAALNDALGISNGGSTEEEGGGDAA